MKLFYFSNLKGVEGWAASADAFRFDYQLPASACTVVRANHAGVDPPPGYVKTSDAPMGPVVRAAAKQKRSTFLTSFTKLLDDTH